MKKILYTVLAAGTLAFTTSCEDRGTTFETVEANENEKVNPNHIRPYSNLDSLSRMVQLTTASVPANGQLATEMVKVYYKPDQDISDIVQQFNLSETARMTGQAGATRDVTSGSDPMEQQSMTTVQDSLNEVTGDANKEAAKPEQKKATQKSNTTKQPSAADTKTKKQ